MIDLFLLKCSFPTARSSPSWMLVINKPDCTFDNLLGLQTLEGDIPGPCGRAREARPQGHGIPGVTLVLTTCACSHGSSLIWTTLLKRVPTRGCHISCFTKPWEEKTGVFRLEAEDWPTQFSREGIVPFGEIWKSVGVFLIADWEAPLAFSGWKVNTLLSMGFGPHGKEFSHIPS